MTSTPSASSSVTPTPTHSSNSTQRTSSSTTSTALFSTTTPAPGTSMVVTILKISPVPASIFSALNNKTLRECFCQCKYTGDVAKASGLNLPLSRRSLSKYKRMSYSVPDYRPVSVALGTSSLLLLFTLVALITVADITRLARWISLKRRRKHCQLKTWPLLIPRSNTTSLEGKQIQPSLVYSKHRKERK